MQIKELVSKDYIKLDKKEPISRLLGQLKLKKKRNALIFDGKNFLGIVSKRALLRSKLMMEMKIEKIVRPVATVSEEADVLEAAYLMYNVDTSILPVERKGRVVGVLEILDLLEQLKNYPEIRKVRVSEINFQKIKPFSEKERIGKIVNEMNTFKSYSMPIVGKDGKLQGLISISDIYDHFVGSFPIRRGAGFKVDMTKTKSYEAERPNLSAMPVSGFGSLRDLCYIDVDGKMFDVVRKMRKHGVMSIVAMKNEKPVGVVTANNVLRLMAALYKGPEYNVWISGLKKTDLQPYQKEYIQKIVSNFGSILGKALKNDFILRVNIKEYEKGGKRHKWSVTMNVQYPGIKITAKEADWDIETALRKNFNNVQKQISHHHRTDTTGNKPYE